MRCATKNVALAVFELGMTWNIAPNHARVDPQTLGCTVEPTDTPRLSLAVGIVGQAGVVPLGVAVGVQVDTPILDVSVNPRGGNRIASTALATQCIAPASWVVVPGGIRMESSRPLSVGSAIPAPDQDIHAISLLAGRSALPPWWNVGLVHAL